MEKRIHILLFILLAQTVAAQSPAIPEKLKQFDKFVHYLKENDQQAIYDMSFHTPSTNISDAWSRKSLVKLASELIAKYGLPPKKDWVYNYNVHNYFDRFSVKINFVIPVDTVSERRLVAAYILIAFPPEQISDSIYQFKVENKYYWPHGMKLEAPAKPNEPRERE